MSTIMRRISFRAAAFVALGLLAIGALPLGSDPALAQGAPAICTARDGLLTQLESKYGEIPVAIGVADGALIELLTAKDGITWTIILGQTDGPVGAGASGCHPSPLAIRQDMPLGEVRMIVHVMLSLAVSSSMSAPSATPMATGTSPYFCSSWVSRPSRAVQMAGAPWAKAGSDPRGRAPTASSPKATKAAARKENLRIMVFMTSSLGSIGLDHRTPDGMSWCSP